VYRATMKYLCKLGRYRGGFFLTSSASVLTDGNNNVNATLVDNINDIPARSRRRKERERGGGVINIGFSELNLLVLIMAFNTLFFS